MLRLRLWRLDLRKRTWVDCHEDNLGRLVQHSRESPGKSLGLQERLLLQGPSKPACLQITGLCIHKCHRWDELVVI